MPKRRDSERIRCPNFTWRLFKRHGIWYADGRSNNPNVGRHSLGTHDKQEALAQIVELDRIRAEELGLIPASEKSPTRTTALSLADGRKLYEQHIARPRVTGGVRASTAKRYRTVFDKFIKFATSRGATTWNVVTADSLTAYAEHLGKNEYAPKTQVNELTVLKQAIKWMIEAGHLVGKEPIKLKLRTAESQPAYRYRAEEVAAMVELCRIKPELCSLGDVIVGLACTGLRIAELAALRWSDVDIQSARLKLTDETGTPIQPGQQRREIKSGRSRSFPIHPDFLAALKQMQRRDQYVFHGPRGGRLKPDTIRRIFIREVIARLEERFPVPKGERGFRDGRMHSFRHFFCSTCSNNGVPERMVMDWLGHQDSAMIGCYYHQHDLEARRHMNKLDFLGGAGGRSGGDNQTASNGEAAEPNRT